MRRAFEKSGTPIITGFALTATLLAASVASADNWPNWRGPTNRGLSAETNLPTTWSKTEHVAWRMPLPGPAGATPVVWENRLFLTSVDDGELVLLCVGTDGKLLWRQIVGNGNHKARGNEGNSASPSPVTDGEHVWVCMGSGDLACYDFDGKLVWTFNLQERYGKVSVGFGLTSTPVLHEDRLFLQRIHGDGNPETPEAVVFAIDKLTGEEIWKQVRVSDAIKENEHSYASTIVYDDGKSKFLISHGADYTIAHSLADGHEIWRCGGLNPRNDPKRRYDPTLRFVASPVAEPGLIVIPTAKGGPVVAIRPDGRGDITNDPRVHLWTYPRTPDVPSPLIYGDYVYLCKKNGNLHCLDKKTGELIYEQRTNRAQHRASPVGADGKVYLAARDGKVTVVRAGAEFEILAENDIGETLSASPAISNGTIYLRSFDALWAIRGE